MERLKGVHFRKDKNKWEVRKKQHNKRYFLGYFNTLEEANNVLGEWLKDHPDPPKVYKNSKPPKIRKTIKYTQICPLEGYFTLYKRGIEMFIIFDWEDYDLISKYSWHLTSSRKLSYVQGYIPGNRKATNVKFHRLVMNAPKTTLIDHINGNTLDNRKGNLRQSTVAENNSNLTRVRKNNTSGYRGVYYNSNAGKWVAQANLNNIRYYLGLFNTPEKANEAIVAWRKDNMPFSYLDQAA